MREQEVFEMASDLGQAGPDVSLEARIRAVWSVVVFLAASH
jgi:hypothetical protein